MAQVDLPTFKLTFLINGTPGWVVLTPITIFPALMISAKVFASAGTEAKEKINTRTDTAIRNLFIASSSSITTGNKSEEN
jgi:hypothetical protein